MANRNLVLGLVLGGCAVVAACSSDGDDSSNTGGTGGTHSTAGASAGGSGGKAAGGSGGKAGGSAGASDTGGAKETGGEGGAANGEAGAGGEGGAPIVPPPPLNPHFVLIPTAAPTTAPSSVLVAGTDYTHTEVTSVTLASGAETTPLDFMDGDTIPVSSGGIGFALERTNDKVHLLDGGTVKTTFDLTDAGTATAALTANKAYVGLYNKSLISILDLSANKISRRIDLSAFNATGDADGSADITAAAYDATAKIAYFLLARIDLTTIVAPNYTLPCSTTKSIVVAIDTTTDAVVDLNGAADGQALELTLASPQTLAIDATGKLLTVAAAGCYDGTTLKNDGVEVLSLTSGTSTVAYAGTSTYSPSGLVLLGANAALLQANDATFTTHWFKLDLGTGTLGTELLHVPSSASYDGTNLIGVNATTQKSDVVRYDIATDAVTATISATSLTGVFTTPYGTALVQ